MGFVKRVSHFFKGVFEMARMAFHAHPLYFVALIIVQVLLGIRPVVSAWVISQLVDVLASNVQGDILEELANSFTVLLIIQG
ncbi:MAG: hypothetical protein AAF126_08350, partial [Chloroflexota bacterium]